MAKLRIQKQIPYLSNLDSDIPAGLVVFLVALPLCLGIALASGAPLFSGLIAGIIGGTVVAMISNSNLGVSGPAAGLTVIVFEAISELGFEAFLLAVILAGCIQIILGSFKAGIIGYYFPSAVISGMLAGIGLIIFLKQIPHAVGYDKDYEGDLAFYQQDDYTTLSELEHIQSAFFPGAICISLLSLAILLLWESRWFKQFQISRLIHAAVLAVVASIFLNEGFRLWLPEWALTSQHLVNLPVLSKFSDFGQLLIFPDWSQFNNLLVYKTALILALVASIETLLSVEAVDKLDPYKRVTDNNQELKAQGVGNICSGLIGGLPITQVIIRSSTNVQAGAKTKMSTITHGFVLLLSVLFIPELLNKIPLASLAAILLVVGYKLASPRLFKKMYHVGPYHFIPFIATVLGLVFTNMLMGIAIGLAFAIFFILLENQKVGVYLHEYHQANKTIITLSENVSFLNKANLLRHLDKLPNYSTVIIDATYAKYIDYDIYEILQNFKAEAKRKNIKLIIQNLRGYGVLPPVEPSKPSTKELQQSLTPDQVLNILKQGNDRFVNNLKTHDNLLQRINETVTGQYPLAIILSCIDSRTSAELIFDQSLGDIFSVRIAGNIINDDILGSMEFACKISGAKLIVVLGHTRCGAIKGACAGAKLDHLTGLLEKITPAIKQIEYEYQQPVTPDNTPLVEKVSNRNVELMVRQIRKQSPILAEMKEKGEIDIVGAFYNIETGRVLFQS
jgi:MFS superfamily sulfate permease-like transporter